MRFCVEARNPTLYISTRNRGAGPSSPVMMLVLFSLGSGCGRRDPGRFLPIVLHRRRKFLDARQEGRDFPHVRFTQSLVPGGHPGVADAGAHGVVNVPLGIVHGLDDQLRSWRVAGPPEVAGFVVEVAVTSGAVHGVDFHSVDQILVRGWDGTGHTRGVTLHGGIQSGHGEVALDLRRSRVGVGGQEAERGDGQTSQEEEKQGNDDAEDKITHSYLLEKRSFTLLDDAVKDYLVESREEWRGRPALPTLSPAV